MATWLEWVLLGAVAVDLALVTYIAVDIARRLRRLEAETNAFMQDVEKAFERADEFNEQLKELMRR